MYHVGQTGEILHDAVSVGLRKNYTADIAVGKERPEGIDRGNTVSFRNFHDISAVIARVCTNGFLHRVTESGGIGHPLTLA